LAGLVSVPSPASGAADTVTVPVVPAGGLAVVARAMTIVGSAPVT
jgi:hypothetical protein